MNDIEILENLIKHIRFNEPLHYGIGLYIKAIENLLKERQEDKEKIKDSLPKKFLIELINKNKINISGFECIATEDLWKWVTN